MKKILIFFSCFIMLPVFSYADTPSETQNIDAETNISAVQESIKFNDEEFNKIAEQIAKRYPNFDWIEFDKLDAPTKRMVLKNYLARLAFEEMKEKYIKDINARAKDGVIIEKYDGDTHYDTYYFNKSDEKYRTDYITGQDLAKKAKVRNKCDGCTWVYFKQTDVKKLNELIKQETAKAPVDTHCEKYCLVFNQAQWDEDQNFLARLKNGLQDYKKVQKQYLSDLRKRGTPRKEIKEERKKIADEIRKLEQDYNNWEKVFKDRRKWFERPYTETCEMVSVECSNVEQRPEDYEKFELSIQNYPPDDETKEEIEEIHYEYDDLSNKTHMVVDAWKMCTCNHDINDLESHVNCECDINFFDVDQDFTEVRNWENQHRIDIKNGKYQDRNEDGTQNYDWQSNTSPGGMLHGRTFTLSGQSDKTVTKGRNSTDEN